MIELTSVWITCPICCAIQCVTHIDTSFLQMFLWERGSLSLKSHGLPTIEIIETIILGVQVEKPNNAYKTTTMRWANVKQWNNKKLSKLIDVEKNYIFHPYSTLLVNFNHCNFLRRHQRHKIDAEREYAS